MCESPLREASSRWREQPCTKGAGRSQEHQRSVTPCETQEKTLLLHQEGLKENSICGFSPLRHAARQWKPSSGEVIRQEFLTISGSPAAT